MLVRSTGADLSIQEIKRLPVAGVWLSCRLGSIKILSARYFGGGSSYQADLVPLTVHNARKKTKVAKVNANVVVDLWLCLKSLNAAMWPDQ